MVKALFKNALALMIVLSVVLSLAPYSVSAQNVVGGADNSEYVKFNGASWGIDRSRNELTWIPRDWAGGEVPTEIDGMKVESIGDYAAYNHKNIKEVIIPEGITTVCEGAFESCSRIAKVTFASSVKSIGNYAFESCDELEDIVYKGKVSDIKFGNYVYQDTYYSHPDFSAAYKRGIYYKRLHEVKLTGDLSDDMIAIATSQIGYHHGNDETEMHGYNKLGGEYYSEYNYFTGSPDWQWVMKGLVRQEDYEYGYGGWCGNFCDWSMSMAGVPSECATYYKSKEAKTWKETVYAGGSYEIKPGDIMHMSAGHYCMVTGVMVSGNKVNIKTLNGNPDVEIKTYSLNKKDGSNDDSHNYDFREILPLDESKLSDVKSFTVDFDADGGSQAFSSKVVYEGAFYGLLPKPSKAGYTFDGWYTGKNGTGKKITSYRNVWLDGNITLYANYLNGSEPAYLDMDSYVSKAPKHSSIMDQFARIYLTKSKISYKKVKKKAQKTYIRKMNGKGATTYKNVTTGSKKKYIKISKTGTVTIKKGAPKGTYSVFVTVEKYKTVNMSQATVHIVVK